ncbi:GNAT family N-acetyltransferase [Micromonospora lutea]|uniref:N-acetyltransferase n=1 Tax=Micromonospora lutea TaxID=419825 RepID=A0ABQ4IQ96_9ACTN|nr:GNAT family N-acetyltransferase [Micromonospora lutea]GIJ20081.1 N-acetyltransferase [Micromonospora lutea]
MHEIQIQQVPFDSPVAQRLITATLADLAARYGGSGDATPVDAHEFVPPAGAFLVAQIDGQAVGCGGWRSHGEATAELKRMYTAPEVRGRGVARTLLAAIERSAREHGRRRLILECGDRQPEAIALYKAAGYERIPNFGFYADEPGCLSFGRTL